MKYDDDKDEEAQRSALQSMMKRARGERVKPLLTITIDHGGAVPANPAGDESETVEGDEPLALKSTNPRPKGM